MGLSQSWIFLMVTMRTGLSPHRWAGHQSNSHLLRTAPDLYPLVCQLLSIADPYSYLYLITLRAKAGSRTIVNKLNIPCSQPGLHRNTQHMRSCVPSVDLLPYVLASLTSRLTGNAKKYLGRPGHPKRNPKYHQLRVPLMFAGG